MWWKPPGEGYMGHFFVGYVQLASQNVCPILAYVVANYRPHLVEEWYVRLACPLPWRHYSTLLDIVVKVTSWSFGEKKTFKWACVPLCHADFILTFDATSNFHWKYFKFSTAPFFSTLYHFINNLIGLFLKTPFFFKLWSDPWGFLGKKTI